MCTSGWLPSRGLRFFIITFLLVQVSAHLLTSISLRPLAVWAAHRPQACSNLMSGMVRLPPKKRPFRGLEPVRLGPWRCRNAWGAVRAEARRPPVLSFLLHAQGTPT